MIEQTPQMSNDDHGPDAVDGKLDDVTAAALIEAIKTVYDPEIPVNVYDLGLIYEIAIDDAAKVWVKMTLTAPACPVAGSLPNTVATAIKQVAGVSDAQVELVWDPPWSTERMSDEARLTLNMFD